ncbi:DUF4190 domain-containing protein [Zobellia nedashkovskayae]
MTKANRQSHGGFMYAIITLGLSLISITLILVKVTQNTDSTSIMVGLLILVSGLLAIIGLVKSLKGIKEPNTFRKISGLLINFLISVCFILAVTTNIVDIIRYIAS